VIGIRSITFGEVVSISFADSEQTRDFAMVSQTLVLDPTQGERAELIAVAEAAIMALLLDTLEDIQLSDPPAALQTDVHRPPEAELDDDEEVFVDGPG
jgi:hypothetical protein